MMGNFKDTPKKSPQLLNENIEIPQTKPNANPKKSEKEVFLQQSVTLLAFKDRASINSTSPGATPKLILGIFKEDLPLFVGAIIGASLVIALCLLIFIIWKCCCRMTVLSKKKEYWLQPKNTTSVKGRSSFPAVQSSVVFLGLKPTQDFAYKREKSMEDCIGTNFFTNSSDQDFVNSTFDDSVSYTMSSQCPEIIVSNEDKPVSNGQTNLSNNVYSPNNNNQTCSVISSSSLLQSGNTVPRKNSSILSPIDISIPNVTIHQESPAPFHRSFYSGNFDQHSLYSCDSHPGSDISFRKCSSFTWSNYSLRPASSDCYYDIFQKASICKKRKNRMRSDIAAAIALNRSQSSQLNKDTDLLVENEVEVILAERTTL